VIIEIPNVWASAEVDHRAYLKRTLRPIWLRLRRQSKYKTASGLKTIRDTRLFLATHRAAIFGTNSGGVVTAITAYASTFVIGTPSRTMADELMRKLFLYEKFAYAKSGWNAYALCKRIPYKICPYCHINQIGTYVSATKSYRPNLDHFFCHQLYPFLALSLSNLVPSCEKCNQSQLKGTTDCYLHPHLSPLTDACALTFVLKPEGNQPWTPTLKALREPAWKYEIDIEARPRSVSAINSLATLALKPRYADFVHDAHKIAKAGQSPAWKRMIANLLNLPSSVDELGFSTAPGSMAFKNVPQGKMRLDIHNAYKKT
jgi:hypothetical protein